MILGSITPEPPPPGFLESWLWKKAPIVIPLTKVPLGYKDNMNLTDLGLHKKERNNLQALAALYQKAQILVTSILFSRPGSELSHDFILQQIKSFLENTQDGKFYLCSTLIEMVYIVHSH